RLRRELPKGTEGLAKGKERIAVHFSYSDQSSKPNRSAMPMSWDDIFSAIAPCMIREASEYSMRQALRDAIFKGRADLGQVEKHHIDVDSDDFGKAVVQLRALGFIVPSSEKRSVKDRGVTYWSLTPFGDENMNRLLSIPSSK